MNSHILNLAHPSLYNCWSHSEHSWTWRIWILKLLHGPHEVVIHQFPRPVFAKGMSSRNTIGSKKVKNKIIKVRIFFSYFSFSYSLSWDGFWWLISTVNVRKAMKKRTFILGMFGLTAEKSYKALNFYTELWRRESKIIL